MRQFPSIRDGFYASVVHMTSAPIRPEVSWQEIPAPPKLAPHTHAVSGEVTFHHEQVASGRLILLYDPAGQETWAGTHRFVALVQAQLEPEFAVESMLGDVAWSWVTESLELYNAVAHELGCTVTRVVSQSYGSLASRPASVDVELRASWTPELRPVPDADQRSDASLAARTTDHNEAAPHASSRRRTYEAPDLSAHFQAWSALLCAAGGLPPLPPGIKPLTPTHRARAPHTDGEAR